jgi:hypothetical protein
MFLDPTATLQEGIHVYIGAPGSGKTHKAIRDAYSLAKREGLGVLVIDSRGAKNLVEIPETKPPELYRKLWAGEMVRRIPYDQEEFDSIIAEVDARGHCAVLIDEVSEWATNRSMKRLLRVWRHRKVSVFLTSQMIGRDIEQAVQACNPVLYLFRCTAPTTLEWVEKWHRLPQESLRALPVGAFYPVQF